MSFLHSMGILTTISHILIGGITVITMTFGYNSTGTKSFQQHIELCTCGYVLLLSQGILSLNKQNGWNLNFYTKNIVHRAIGVIGAAIAIAGSVIRIQGWPGNSFSTPHGICGWIALIMTCITLVGGVISIYIEQKRVFRAFHALLGCTTFCVAMITLCYGFDKSSFRTWTSDTTAITMIVLTAIATVAIAIPVVFNVYRRITGSYYSSTK